MKRALAAAGLALAAVVVSSASGASHVLIPGCGGADQPAYKPAAVIVACGDGNFQVVKLKWSSWTATSASGKGTAKVNTCQPNCARGKFKSYKLNLSADKPKSCPKGKQEFSRLSYSYPHSRPSGTKATGSVSRPCTR